MKNNGYFPVLRSPFPRRVLSRSLLLVPLFSVLAGLLLAVPARAEWYEASSDHFVIYANDKEKDVRQFAENLERYHAALKIARTFGDKPPPSPSNRVTVYVAKSEGTLQKIYGSNGSQVAGFYIPRAGASVAFTQPVESSGNDQIDFSQTILLHEYAHHFMISNLSIALPSWYTEGFAEVFGTTSFGKDGSVGMGKPAAHRSGELAYAKKVPWERLFDSRAYARYKAKNKEPDAFYGQSWLVFHYLQFNEEGDKTHLAFLNALIAGNSDVDAARMAFGDLKAFGRKMDRYLQSKRLSYFALKPELLKVGTVTLRQLSAGEAAIMPFVMQSNRGVNREQALKLAVEMRNIAASYTGDAKVQAALAEAEFDAGNDDAAIAAANAALAIEPTNMNALIQKGYALFQKAEASDDKAAAFIGVRKHFSQINKIENDHPIPMIYFYRSFRAEGKEPSANAKTALDYASQLSPFDKDLRFRVAVQDINDGRYVEARRHLLILLSDPHRQQPAEGKEDVFGAMLKIAETKLGIREPTADTESEIEGEKERETEKQE